MVSDSFSAHGNRFYSAFFSSSTVFILSPIGCAGHIFWTLTKNAQKEFTLVSIEDLKRIVILSYLSDSDLTKLVPIIDL